VPMHQSVSIRAPVHVPSPNLPFFFLIYPQIAVTFATRADEATRALLPAGDTDVDLDDHVYKVSSFSLLPYIGISHLSSCTPSSCIFIPSMASSLWTTVGPGA
jgi:hypothetical protein